jgi:hypothetical protein
VTPRNASREDPDVETVGYEYDVFLSYTRRAGGAVWVKEHFHPALRDALENCMPRKPKIFVDFEQKGGTVWRQEVERSLLRSRLLVAVYSPPYFRSDWCLAEWTTMIERCRKLGLGTKENPRSLIHGIRHHDGDYYPAEAKAGIMWDFRRWNKALKYETYSRTDDYPEFLNQVELVAHQVACHLDEAPEWDENWPFVSPDPPDELPPGPVPTL